MRIFSDLPQNTRSCLIVEPLWALFGGVIFYFAPLYQKDLGLSDIQMGLINSFGLAFSFVFFLLAGPVTNKFGRHWTSLLWDLFSWTVSMVLWGLAQNFWWFFAAVFFNSAVRMTMVSWNLLVSEDATEDQRTRVFGIVNLLGSLGGLVSLAAGLLIDAFGVVPTMRVTYLAGAVSMTTMFVVRFFMTKETENGKQVRAMYKTTPLTTMVVDQLKSLGHAAKDKHFSVLTGLYLIATAIGSFTFFQIVYLKEELGYSTTELAIIPGVNTVLIVLLLTLLMPRIPRHADRTGVLVGFVLCLVGALAFLGLGKGMFWAVLAVQGLGAAALVLIGTYRDSVFMNSVDETKRAELFGLVNMLAMLLSIPTGWLAGWLYTVHVLAPFVALAVLFAAGLGLTLSLMGHHKRAQTSPSAN